MFSGRPSVRASIRDSRGSFMFPRCLQYLLTDFRQSFVTGASRDRDDLITFLGQKVKVQGHAIPAEAHSTRRYRRVQLFLVDFCGFYCAMHAAVVSRSFVRLSVCPSATLRYRGHTGWSSTNQMHRKLECCKFTTVM